jgi:hypothetical protein
MAAARARAWSSVMGVERAGGRVRMCSSPGAEAGSTNRRIVYPGSWGTFTMGARGRCGGLSFVPFPLPLLVRLCGGVPVLACVAGWVVLVWGSLCFYPQFKYTIALSYISPTSNT